MSDVKTPPRKRRLPPPMKLQFKGGMIVELLEDQRFADDVVIRKGERGQTICPSSQAASWTVLFARVSSKPRVVSEWLIKPAE